MNCGQIVQVDTVKSLLCKPADEFVARLLGYDNIFRGKLVKNDSGLLFLDVSDIIIKAVGHEKDGEYIVGIRPEDVSVSSRPVDPSGVNVLQGIVADTSDLGPIVSVSVDAGFKVKASIAKGSFLELNLDKGMRVWLSFKFESVKLLNKHQIVSAKRAS
jgi:molybdate/tungstate transport system ATP-binding protein